MLDKVVLSMPRVIEGIPYYTNEEVARLAGVTRQSLWRWRQEAQIPSGRQYRGRLVLFTEDEVEQIKDFANRMEPIGSPQAQLPLFRASVKGGDQ
jgi:predicted DNA-binding transcriptional regulator AlpA